MHLREIIAVMNTQVWTALSQLCRSTFTPVLMQLRVYKRRFKVNLTSEFRHLCY